MCRKYEPQLDEKVRRLDELANQEGGENFLKMENWLIEHIPKTISKP